MAASAEGVQPVRAKAALVDPRSMRVVWLNESARQDFGGDLGDGIPLATAVPLAEVLGVSGVIAEVSETGEARHVSADLVSTTKGSVAIVASVYRLPDGMVLVLIENAWQPGRDKPKDGTPRRAGRGRR